MTTVVTLCQPQSRGFFAMPATGQKQGFTALSGNTTLVAHDAIERSYVWLPQGNLEAFTN